MTFLTSDFVDGKALYFSRPDASLRVPIPPPGKVFVRIKHAYEMFGEPTNKGIGKAVPEIVNKDWGLVTKYNGREYDYVELEDRWQWFIWNLLDWGSGFSLPRGKIEGYYQKPGNDRTFAIATPGSLTWAYVNLVEAHRAFTEDASPEGGFRDAVTGRNLENPEAYNWLLRPTGGHLALAKAVGSYYELDAIDLLEPCPEIEEVVQKPWLYFWATEATVQQYPDKRWGVSMFPQIKTVFRDFMGYPISGTPCPFFSLGGTVRIKKTSCLILSPGGGWSPYIPEV